MDFHNTEKRLRAVNFRWRKVASLGQGRREDLSHACVVYNGSILLMGGQGEGEQVIKSQKEKSQSIQN